VSVALVLTWYKGEAALFRTLLQKSWMQHNVLGSVGFPLRLPNYTLHICKDRRQIFVHIYQNVIKKLTERLDYMLIFFLFTGEPATCWPAIKNLYLSWN
jgi:hypothetical protein